MESLNTPKPYKTYGRKVRSLEKQQVYYSRIARKRLKNRRLQNKLEFLKRLGGKCSICGWDKHHAALEFDHIERSSKEHDVGKVLDWVDREEAWREVSKCRILCSNCHRIESYENNHLGQSNTPYRRRKAWLVKCEICGETVSTKSPRTKYCGVRCKDSAHRLRRKT